MCEKNLSKCVADLAGPWIDPDFASGLVERCKAHWNVPISQLPDVMLATYLGQKIALGLIIPEAEQRIAESRVDGTELFSGQLAESLALARMTR